MDALAVKYRGNRGWLQLTGRQYLFIGSILALILVGVWVVLLRPWEESVLDRYKVHVPTDMPAWLIPLESGYPKPSAKLGTGPWTHQDWCTLPNATDVPLEEVRTAVAQARNRQTFMAALVCVSLWQAPWEMDAQTNGRAPIQVGGVTGWAWRLEPGDFIEDPNAIAGEEWVQGSLTLALAQRFKSLPDAIGRAYLYFDAAGTRHGEFGRLAGPALAIQWNKDRQHYLLMSEDRTPITGEVLRAMADSLVPVKDLQAAGG